MINDLPTVYEVVFGLEQSDEQSGMDNGAKDTPAPQKLNFKLQKEDDSNITAGLQHDKKRKVLEKDFSPN
uniref:Uncharacterized protein n=1 Tax=Oryza nivara TaxID=4536 RepID=A0A0E0FGJ0_ORYNI